MSTLAAGWANTVHHVVKTSVELCKLGINLSLCVLARSDRFIKVRLEACGQCCFHICDVNVLSFSNLLEGRP
jgi:hypothetical protein